MQAKKKTSPSIPLQRRGKPHTALTYTITLIEVKKMHKPVR